MKKHLPPIGQRTVGLQHEAMTAQTIKQLVSSFRTIPKKMGYGDPTTTAVL